jgi:hypothetical protein
MFSYSTIDGLVKSHSSVFVIPAKAGIQENQPVLDSRFRGRDGLGDFLRLYQPFNHSTRSVFIVREIVEFRPGGLSLSSPAMPSGNVFILKSPGPSTGDQVHVECCCLFLSHPDGLVWNISVPIGCIPLLQSEFF